MPFTKDIVTHYGAVGDGTTNDRPAFVAWQADAIASSLDCVLTSPSGKTFYIGPATNPTGSNEDYFFSGIPSLLVDFNGSTLTDAGSGNDFHLGCRHGLDDATTGLTRQALIETVVAGSNTIVLKTSSDHSMFTVGDWAMLGGLHLQDGGFPPNPHFFEFVQVASKQTTTLPYSITFTASLSNSYKSTWPDWGTGFGPASLYRLEQVWNCVHDYRNFTLDKTGGPNPLGAGRKSTNCGGRLVTLTNVTPTNYDGINPSATVKHTLIGCNYAAVTMEVDKCIGELAITAGSVMGTVDFQSSSVDLLTISASTLNGTLNGTAKKTVISAGSSLQVVYPGSHSYGACTEFNASDSSIAGLGLGGFLYQGGNPGLGQSFGVNNSGGAMTAGVIRIPKSFTAQAASVAVPGAWLMFQDQDRVCIRIFQVLDVTEDGTYVYVHTSESGTWPVYDTAGGGKLYIRAHPAAKVTVRNCTGCTDMLSLSQAPVGAPLYSYSQRTYNGKADTEGDGTLLWGNVVSLDYNVTAATAAAKSFQPMGDHCWMSAPDGTLPAYPGFAPTIDFHATGRRTITAPGGVQSNINPFQSGDSGYTLPDMWMAGIPVGNTVGGVLTTGSQSITVTLKTDQGIPQGRSFECTFT